MANAIVAEHSESAQAAAEFVGPPNPPYTPQRHAEASGLKVLRVISLGDGPLGKTALFEFEGGFVREMVIDAQSIWHPSLRPLNSREKFELREHVIIPLVGADGARVEQYGPMWFNHGFPPPTRRHAYRRDMFNVPKETCYRSTATGAKAARDLLVFLKGAVDDDAFLIDHIVDMLRDASAATREDDGADYSRGFAAREFLTILAQYLFQAAKHANHRYLDGRFDWRARDARAYSAFVEAKIAERKAAVAEQMQRLRQAKAAKRLTIGGPGPSVAKSHDALAVA